MADPKEKTDEASEEEEEAQPKASLFSLPFIGAALGACLLTGGAVFFLAPAPKAAPAEVAEAKNEKDKDSSKKAKSKSDKGYGKKGDGEEAELEGGQWTEFGQHAFLLLDPIAISLNPGSEARYLSITLALETKKAVSHISTIDLLNTRDALLTYLQSTSRKELEDPAYMSKIKYGLKRRISATMPDLKIENVLVTEFLLT